MNITNEMKNTANAVPITDVAVKMGLDVFVKGSYASLRSADSTIIDPRKNCFWRNSQNVTGGTITFVMHFGGMTFPDAVKFILDTNNGTNNFSLPSEILKEREKVPFVLPAQAINKIGTPFNSLIEKYIVKERKIDREIFQWFVDNEYLYQQSIKEKSKYKNDRFKSCCVFRVKTFVDGTYDWHFAEKRAIYKVKNPVKGKIYRKTLTVEGSDVKHGYFINNNSSELIVSEGILDAMAIMSIIKSNKTDFKNYSYLALTGVSKYEVVLNILEENFNIKTVISSLDNDEAGMLQTEKLRRFLHSKAPDVKFINNQPPKEYKDFDDLLMEVKK